MKGDEPTLSQREKQVAEHLMQGRSNKQIALALHISENTIEFHLRNIYNKLQVHSRAEAILKLGKSVGGIEQHSRESVIEIYGKPINNEGKSFLWRRWLVLFKDFSSILKDTASIISKELEVKNRLLSYVLIGFLFGTGFWFYFNNWVGRSTFGLHVEDENPNPLTIWAFISLSLITVFGIWLIPAMIVSVREFRSSRKIVLSAFAVMIVWVSAVFGYYLTYTFLFSFVGFPQLDDFLVFRQHEAMFWPQWGHFFLNVIFFDWLKWTIVGSIGGWFAGLTTSSLYSFWIRKTHIILPA